MTSNEFPPAAPVARTARQLWLEAAAIAALALTLNLTGNGRVSLWDRDEPRYAGCTREMRASGDWVHPTFNAEPRYHKPVLIYWLMLAGTALGGDNPFGARLVSSLAGMGTVLLVWAWGRRHLGERAGRLSALVLATAPIMIAESKMATTDAVLALLVVTCQFALWGLAQAPSRRLAAAFWVALGLAILTKSPAGPVLIGVSAAASWWWGGPIGFLKRLHWKWGVPLAAAIVLPWNIAILLRSQGEYYNVAVGYHIIRRATSGIEEHGGFPGYYLVTGLGTFYPWSALIPAALAMAWAKRRETPMAGFLMGWLIGPLVLLECVRTKLVHYYLPAFPAAALLVGWLVDRLIADTQKRSIREWAWGRFATGMLGLVGTSATLGLIAAAWFFPPEMRLPLALLAILMGTGTVVGLRELLAGRTERAVHGLIGLTALTMLTAGGWLLPSAEPYRVSAVVGRRLAALESTVGLRTVLCTFQFPGTIFTLGHPAPIVKSKEALLAQADRAETGAVVTALLPVELKTLSADPGLSIAVHETIQGFNLDKGRFDTVHLAVVRRADGSDAVAARPERPTRR